MCGIAHEAAFEWTLSELMRTKKGALQVRDLLARIDREIGSCADEGPGGENCYRRKHPLEGIAFVNTTTLPMPTVPDASGL